MRRLIMPLFSSIWGMLIAHPAPFQPFINFSRMPSVGYLPNTIHEPLFRAGACALRVGIVSVVGRANCGVNTTLLNNLSIEHAQTVCVIGHVSRCHTRRYRFTKRVGS